MSIDEKLMTEYLSFAEELAEAAAAVIRPHFRAPLAVEDKGGNLFDPVTVADRDAERIMRTMIQERYPDHGVFGEEEGRSGGRSPLTWVLDPIDGTRAFITGMPLWGTLIALNDGSRPVLGVMNQPFTGERIIGTPTSARLGTRPLRTRPCERLDEARLMCTTPEMFQTPAQRSAFDDLAARVRLRRFGGDCYAYCMLAAGHVDIVVEAALQPYDVQALIPIIEGAGGIITTWDGGDAQHGGTILACGDPALHPVCMEVLRGAA